MKSEHSTLVSGSGRRDPARKSRRMMAALIAGFPLIGFSGAPTVESPQMWDEIAFAVWLCFRLLFILSMAVFLLSGLDDLFYDLLYYGRMGYRWLFRRKVIKPVTREQLNGVPEKLAAILIPAWDESAVISKMLLNTIGTLDYRNFVIFVGTYPNDEATRLEVGKVRDVYTNVEFIVTPAEGPTNKADCLNWIYQGVLLYEKTHHVQFAMYVMHDAEDIVHPLSLKYYNYLIPRVHFIQLPVFPLEGPWHDFVTGIYMDEFAEGHTKDLRVREMVSGCLPSAGVGTALSREAMDYLAQRQRNQLFDIGSLTEDYMMGLKLRDFDGRKIFLQQQVERIKTVKSFWTRKPREKRVLEHLATREFFPSSFEASVRQKSRWILGISLQGWAMGWTRTVGSDYCLYRDRKALVSNLVTMLGYVVALYWMFCASVNALSDSVRIPPLIVPGEIYYNLLYVLLGLLCWRVINRTVAGWRVYGFAHGLLALPRLVVGNFLNFWATVQAIRRYLVARTTGTVPAWGKTEHAWPTEEQMRVYHHRLGDLLLEHRLVTATQLQEALGIQKQTGERLGEILVRRGHLWEEDLAFVLARQKNQEFVEIDPYAVPASALELVPREMAEAEHLFPLSIEGGILVLATDNSDFNTVRERIEARLTRPVRLRLCSRPDIDFAIARAYDRPAGVAVGNRMGERLVREGLITEKDLRMALRRQKRTRQKLGEVLVSMKLMSSSDLEKELKQS